MERVKICHLYVDGCSNRSSPQRSHCIVSATLYAVPPLMYFLELRQAKTSANFCFFGTDAKNKILD